ncbi:MAG: ATP-binding protein [Polaribacter sp.]|uniref:sensor histidine kinase n=1 Tax=Polaribacter sp. TaxID=1920175 RepID=UPI003BAFE0F0
MNSLLKRQIIKYLPKNFETDKDLQTFLDAVNRSYHTLDNQFAMLQRATSISSDELFIANQKLKKESDNQKEVIKKLKNVIDTLDFYELEKDDNLESIDLDSLKLVDYIDNQTKKIIKVNQQRDKLLSNLERQNKELNDYAHMVSHDLKSPLQSIDAITVWMKEDYAEVLNDDCNSKIDLIRDNVEKMDTLVKGILEYSSISKFEKQFYNVDLNILIKDLILKLNLAKNIKIQVANNLPIVQGDVYRLEQLFKNLINNAVTFNDKKNVIIKIGFSEKEDYYEFFIQDNGKGIEEKYFSKIFEVFQKLENNYKSTGIGLSIVKKIVNLYEGVIWIKSEIYQGSTFYFTLKKQYGKPQHALYR